MKRLLAILVFLLIAPAALATFIGYCGNPTPACEITNPGSACFIPWLPYPMCEPCEKCMFSPCYTASGVYATDANDLQLDTIGFPLSASRHYVSAHAIDGETGYGWVSSLSGHLSYTAYLQAAPSTYQKEAEITTPDGAFYRFVENGDGTFTPPKGRFDQLVRNADGSFDLRLQRSRSHMLFDATGNLVSMTDAYGNGLTFTYAGDRLQRVADLSGSGRYLDVTWGADGRISDVADMTGRTVHYDYDSRGVLTEATNALQQTTTYSYVAGRFAPLLSAITDPWGRNVTTITYDAQSRTHSYTESGETWTYIYGYNQDPKVTAKTDSAGNLWKFTYTTGGLVTDRLAPGATVAAHATYDSNGLFLTRTDEAGKKKTFTYNADGSVATVILDDGGPNAVEFRATYDTQFPERVASVTPYHPGTNQVDTRWPGWRTDYYPPGSPAPGSPYHRLRLNADGTTTVVETYVNNAHGQLTSRTDAAGGVTDYGYDAAGNLISITLPANNDAGTRPVYTFTVDALGRRTATTDPLGHTTTHTYDALNRATSMTLPKPSAASPLNFTTTAVYDQVDSSYPGVLFTNITDWNGRVTRQGTDAFGQPVAYVDRAGIVTLYGWNKGLPVATNDANGNITTFTYDALGRMTALNFPDGQHETYAFNPDGTMLRRTDRRGQSLSYTYDGMKRVTAVTYTGVGAINYIYDGELLTQINDTTTSPGEVHTFTYTPKFQLASETQGARGTLNYTYDASERLTSIAVAGGPTTSYAYYPNGSTHTIQWSPVSGNFTYTYGLNGSVGSITFPNGQARSFLYDDQSRVLQVDNVHPAAGHLATFDYGYDVDNVTGLATILGQRSRAVATIPSQSLAGAETRYYYDSLYRLARVDYPAGSAMNGETDSWTYDAIGNRLTATAGTAARTYAYQSIGTNANAWWRMSSDGLNAFTYDSAGNLASQTGYTFNWDQENRLASVGGNVTAAYHYDYAGRRSSKTVGSTTTAYLYDGEQILRENGSTATDYLYGIGIDEPLAMARGGSVSYFDVDDHNSIVAVNAADGTVLNNYQYDAWGEARQSSESLPQPFRFTGREAGEVPGHLYFRARFMAPQNGRFLSEDPLSFMSDDTNPASLWSYTYAVDNPVAYMDPTGLEKCPCKDLKELVHRRNTCRAVSESVIMCIILKESNGDPDAVNGGHVGLMQMGEGAAQDAGCPNAALFSPGENVGCGTAYFCYIFAHHGQGDIHRTLARYRWGANRSNAETYHTRKDPETGNQYADKNRDCTMCIDFGYDCQSCNPNPH